MAGDPVYAPLLLGLGIDSLSMAPPMLPAVKYLVRAMKMSDARQLADEVLGMASAKEIYAKCAQFHRSRVAVE
jgi:phosphotransferase system enzyme I (PtsI)